MPELNWLAVIAATFALFIVSTAYYILVAARLTDLEAGQPADGGGVTPPRIAVELLRNLVLATVVAALADLIGIVDLGGAILLGLGLWIGFPVVLLVGSVNWENVVPSRAATHAGDWLLKLVVAAVIVAVWR